MSSHRKIHGAILCLLVLLTAADKSLAARPMPQQGREPARTMPQQGREPARTMPQQGREAAQTMSYRGAPWLERSERVDEERPEEVIDAMRLEEGAVVADIGAGSGYFARRIARRVGSEGKVYGVDIQPEMLEILAENARDEGIDNIEPVLGDPDDPKLPPGSTDWMLLVDVYHEISDPVAMLSKMREALKVDGRVALLEYRLEDASADHIYADHRMSVLQVVTEWGAAGFELVELLESLPSQHMFIFRKLLPGRADAVGQELALPVMDLLEATAAGVVTVEARGAGRDAVTVSVRRNTDEALLVTLPAGTVFEPRGDGRTMVATRDAYVLLDDDTGEGRVRAAGTRWDLSVADDDVRFDVRPATDDPALTSVVRAVQVGTYRTRQRALSASYGPQSVGTAEAAIWIALHDVDFEEVEGKLGDSEVPALYAAAFGLVYAERAGLEVRGTRMWNSRERIFGRLQVPDLNEWYTSRSR